MIRLPPATLEVLTDLAEFGRRHDLAEARHAYRLLNLDWSTAEALHLMVRLAGRRRILEIGTSNGFSTLWLAAALPSEGEARLISLDRDHEKQKQARFNLERAGLAQRVTLVEGDATAVIATLDGPFDCVFFDADRVSAPAQLALLLPKLTADALLLADNALSHAKEIAGYVERIGQDPGFSSLILPIGKGLHVAVRR